MNKRVLVTATNYSQLCHQAKCLLENKGFEIIENPFGRPLTFEEQIEFGKDVSAVIAGNDLWDRKIFDFMPELKLLCRFGVGYDRVDLQEAKRRKIYVTNAQGLNANAVAEFVIGLIFSMLRNIPSLNASTKMGAWDRFVGYEIKSMTVGLLGLGCIGQRVARKLSSFETRVIAYDKYPDLEVAKQLNVKLLNSIDEVLGLSDIVSVHLPNNKETYHALNDKTFALMKDGSILVNTARGAIVDTQALISALTSKKLSCAAIDVYEEEPIPEQDKLLQIPNLITTPHTAAETYEVYHAIGMHTAQAIIDTFAGKVPANCLTA